MRRQSNNSPICRCYCNNGLNDPYCNGNRKLNVVETCTIEDDCCCKCKNKQQQNQHSSFQGENSQIDEETLRALCALRRKACKFINSETEYTTTDSAPHSNKGCPCQNQTKDEKYLISIEDLLEYSPQSQFLKKLKKHFQCAPNEEPLPSVFNERNSFISNSLEFKDSGQNAKCECKCCSCKEKSKTMRKSPSTLRSEDEKSKVKSKIEKKTKWSSPKKRNDTPDEESAAKTYSKKTPKKSQHISRPRKPVKYRGRRKKKSKDTEKLKSQESFEPTLKKPQEDSCERCWRYASPSRSPVNKPDQRYNPNFRRAHSWQDFSSVKESASEYANSEILDKHTGSFKKQEELTKVFDFPSAQKSQPLNNYTSTRIKEFERDSSPRRALEKSEMRSEEVKKRPQTPQHRPRSSSIKKRKARPKSYTPGVAPKNLSTKSSAYENLNSTDTVQARKASVKAMPTNRTLRSNINANTEASQSQFPVNEKSFYKTKRKSFSTKGKLESKDPERSQQEFISVDFDKQSHCIPDSQFHSYVDSMRTPHSKSTIHKPSSRYNESDQNQKIYSQKPKSPEKIYRNQVRSESPKNIYNDQAQPESPKSNYRNQTRSESPKSAYRNQVRSESPKNTYNDQVQPESQKSNYRNQTRSESPKNIYNDQAQPESPKSAYRNQVRSESPKNIYNDQGQPESPKSAYRNQVRSELPKNIYYDQTQPESPEKIYRNQVRSESPKNIYRNRTRSELPKNMYSDQTQPESAKNIYRNQMRYESPKNNYCDQVPVNAKYFPQEVSQPAKSQSSHAFQSKYLSQERPRTVDHFDSRYTSKNFTRQMMRNEENKFRQPQHEFRPCTCRQYKSERPSRTRPRSYSSDRDDIKKEYCCHCRRKDSSPKDSFRKNDFYQKGVYNEMPQSEEVNEFEEQCPENFAVNPCRCYEWQEPADYSATEERKGKVVFCPYSNVKPEKYETPDDEYPENEKYIIRESQYYPSYPEQERRSNRRYQPNFSNYVPTNYCVFYMKKNQDNKDDEVEVLVEELTERPTRIQKENKTKAVEDKMKKIFESRADSMALRFQKGVSEVARDPESSRTLYF